MTKDSFISHGRLAFFARHKDSTYLYISRAEWLHHESRPYMWRKDVLEGHHPFFSAKGICAINFTFSPLLSFETAWEVFFFQTVGRAIVSLFISFRTTESAISCHPLSQVLSLPPWFYLVRRYDVFLSNEEGKNSTEDWLNLTCFRTFTVLHRKRDVRKEPLQFILETSYRWIIKYWCFSCVSILALF